MKIDFDSDLFAFTQGKPGETRQRRAFLWLPRASQDECGTISEVRWLEFANIEEKYLINWEFQKFLPNDSSVSTARELLQGYQKNWRAWHKKATLYLAVGVTGSWLGGLFKFGFVLAILGWIVVTCLSALANKDENL